MSDPPHFITLTKHAYIEARQDAEATTWTVWWHWVAPGDASKNAIMPLQTYASHDSAMHGARRIARYFKHMIDDDPPEATP